MTITLKVSEEVKKEMIEFFQDCKREKTPPYSIFQADDADCVVTLYESGKAVFQGISADISAKLWIERERYLNPTKDVSVKNSEEKKDNKIINNKVYFANTIGSDEVGTGDYFGPIVVTSACVKKEDISWLEDLGVKDSKKLTDDKIVEIVPQIIKKIHYSSIILSNKEYNERYNSTDMNMNKLKAILHNKVLINLIEKENNIDFVVVDQFAKPYSYFNYLKDAKKVYRNITFLTKAEDQCLSVACASLISRYIFIHEFDKISEDLDVFLPKGAGSEVDQMGIKVVNKYGKEKLKEIAKYNFKNTEKILSSENK